MDPEEDRQRLAVVTVAVGWSIDVEKQAVLAVGAAAGTGFGDAGSGIELPNWEMFCGQGAPNCDASEGACRVP